MGKTNTKQQHLNVRSSSQDRAKIYKIDLNQQDKNDVRVIANEFVDENSSVLDVGCACGDFGALLKNKNCKIYGMEYNPESINFALESQAYEAIHQIDLNRFNEDDYNHYHKFFDVIVLLDILEHLFHPEKTLAFLTKLLKDNGNLIISLPNISFCDIKLGLLHNDFTYTDTGILDRTHIKFYTHKSIAEMMTTFGFEIQECIPKVAYFSQNNVTVPFSVKRYIKKDPHSFVYQYVLNVKISNKNKQDIELINSEKVDIKWSSISIELNKIKKAYLIQRFFPKGSLSYKIAKRIKQYLKR